jgi:hypothetical protein
VRGDGIHGGRQAALLFCRQQPAELGLALLRLRDELLEPGTFDGGLLKLVVTALDLGLQPDDQGLITVARGRGPGSLVRVVMTSHNWPDRSDRPDHPAIGALFAGQPTAAQA